MTHCSSAAADDDDDDLFAEFDVDMDMDADPASPPKTASAIASNKPDMDNTVPAPKQTEEPCAQPVSMVLDGKSPIANDQPSDVDITDMQEDRPQSGKTYAA